MSRKFKVGDIIIRHHDALKPYKAIIKSIRPHMFYQNMNVFQCELLECIYTRDGYMYQDYTRNNKSNICENEAVLAKAKKNHLPKWM